MALLVQYVKLDPPREELVLKSRLTFPHVRYQPFIQNQAGQTVNLVFPISQKDRLKQLCFAFHTNTAASNTASNANVVANLYGDTAAPFKVPLVFHPVMPITRVDLSIGGQVVTINGQMIQGLHLPAIGDYEDAYIDPI